MSYKQQYTTCSGSTSEYDTRIYYLKRCDYPYHDPYHPDIDLYGDKLFLKPAPYNNVPSKYKGYFIWILDDIKSKSSNFSYSTPQFHFKGEYENFEWGYYTFKIYLSNEVEISLVIYQDYHDYLTPIICGHELYEEFYFNVVKGQHYLDYVGSHNFSNSRDVIDYLYRLSSNYDTYKNQCCLKKC